MPRTTLTLTAIALVTVSGLVLVLLGVGSCGSSAGTGPSFEPFRDGAGPTAWITDLGPLHEDAALELAPSFDGPPALFEFLVRYGLVPESFGGGEAELDFLIRCVDDFRRDDRGSVQNGELVHAFGNVMVRERAWPDAPDLAYELYVVVHRRRGPDVILDYRLTWDRFAMRAFFGTRDYRSSTLYRARLAPALADRLFGPLPGVVGGLARAQIAAQGG